MNGLPSQTLHIPLAAGLGQRFDDRARQPPFLDIAKDVQFDELGGLQARYPFLTAAANSSVSDGTTITNARRLAVNGDELLCFTKDALYSWASNLAKWVKRSTYMAVETAEKTVFARAGDQYYCDRAEMGGTVVYAWYDNQGSGTDNIWIAAMDKTTGAVRLAPGQLGNGTRPRLVTLSTKMLLFFTTTGPGLVVVSLDPTASDIAASVSAASNVLATTANSYYDVVRIPGADTAIGVCRRSVTTSYEIFKVTAALVITQATKARVCTGAIAISCPPTGTTAQVIRANATNVQGDLITVSSLADSITGQAVGTTGLNAANMIAAAHRSVQNGGQYRCYAFWSSSDSTALSINYNLKTNYVDTGGTIGTQSTMLGQMSVATRAFDYDGSVYFCAAFCESNSMTSIGSGYTQTSRVAVQSSYFLMRDDGLLCAKIAANRAAAPLDTPGWLPTVDLTSGTTGYSFCATEKRVIPVGANAQGYADRGPRDVYFAFDSNSARRTARFGNTLYVTGGEVLQYDGVQLVESGFHVFPYNAFLSETAAGNALGGTYAIKATYRWDNASGERDRSTTAAYGSVTIATPPGGIAFAVAPDLPITHKTSGVAIEMWRTTVNPADPSAPFFLVTNLDPAVTTNPNRYLASTWPAGDLGATTVNDEFADTTLASKGANDENGLVLEAIAPPAASVIMATDTRLFLAGIAGEPNRVWYSKQRVEGYAAQWNDALVIDVPPLGGAITALVYYSDTLFVFRETAIYAFPGDGFDNTGGGNNFGPSRTISVDVGAVSQEAVALVENGVFFKSSRGWYLYEGGAPQYIGGPVVDFDTQSVYAVQPLESKNQVRCLLSGAMLVFDTVAKQWASWTVTDGLHAGVWNGAYCYLATGGVRFESTSYASMTYGIDIETTWIKLSDLQGFSRVLDLMVLGEWRSNHRLRVRMARDYQTTGVSAALATIVINATGTTLRDYETGTTPVPVTTSGANWVATFTSDEFDNEEGNDVSLGISFITTSGATTFTVQQGAVYSQFEQTWIPRENCVGVLLQQNAGSPATVLQLETAIASSGALVCSSHDPTPTKTIAAANFTKSLIGQLSGGRDAQNYFDDVRWTPDATVVGGPLQVKIGPSIQRVEAIKIRLTAEDLTTDGVAPTGEALKLTGLALKYATKTGLNRVRASQRL